MSRYTETHTHILTRNQHVHTSDDAPRDALRDDVRHVHGSKDAQHEHTSNDTPHEQTLNDAPFAALRACIPAPSASPTHAAILFSLDTASGGRPQIPAVDFDALGDAAARMVCAAVERAGDPDVCVAVCVRLGARACVRACMAGLRPRAGVPAYRARVRAVCDAIGCGLYAPLFHRACEVMRDGAVEHAFVLFEASARVAAGGGEGLWMRYEQCGRCRDAMRCFEVRVCVRACAYAW